MCYRDNENYATACTTVCSDISDRVSSHLSPILCWRAILASQRKKGRNESHLVSEVSTEEPPIRPSRLTPGKPRLSYRVAPATLKRPENKWRGIPKSQCERGISNAGWIQTFSDPDTDQQSWMESIISLGQSIDEEQTTYGKQTPNPILDLSLANTGSMGADKLGWILLHVFVLNHQSQI